jgi:hypothetical protein
MVGLTLWIADVESTLHPALRIGVAIAVAVGSTVGLLQCQRGLRRLQGHEQEAAHALAFPTPLSATQLKREVTREAVAIALSLIMGFALKLLPEAVNRAHAWLAATLLVSLFLLGLPLLGSVLMSRLILYPDLLRVYEMAKRLRAGREVGSGRTGEEAGGRWAVGLGIASMVAVLAFAIWL